jgi:hypothetical protein
MAATSEVDACCNTIIRLAGASRHRLIEYALQLAREHRLCELQRLFARCQTRLGNELLDELELQNLDEALVSLAKMGNSEWRQRWQLQRDDTASMLQLLSEHGHELQPLPAAATR